MKYWFALILLFLLLPVKANAAVVGRMVDYKHGDAALQGYVVYDDSFEGKRPGVLVAHEWKGFGDYVKMRADQLAKLGYVSFAIDMYGKGIYAKNHEEAAKLSGIYRNDRKLMRERARVALETLKKNPMADPSQIAAIGYCFGGAAVLEMARAGFDLKGVVSFHGSLDTPIPAEPGSIKGKVLVLHGAEDRFVTQEQVSNFQEEMRKAGVDSKVVQFNGAVHGFTVFSNGSDKSSGVAYNEAADKRSWELMKNFLEEVF